LIDGESAEHRESGGREFEDAPRSTAAAQDRSIVRLQPPMIIDSSRRDSLSAAKRKGHDLHHAPEFD
jgi:hypothetical protein